MQKFKLLKYLVIVIFINVVLPFNTIDAKEYGEYASIPTFNIELNDIKIDNAHRKYPLLVYKGITYFPMTWYDCRLLGLENEWSQKDGLKIFQAKVTSSYVSDNIKIKNSGRVKITLPYMKIEVNGKAIDNSKEEYPLFIYNNITYFPMTWRFAHSEFGWKYVWDARHGLNIKSNNPQLKEVNLPEYATQNDIILFEDYYYFVETKDINNNVYRVHRENMLNRELVASYEISTSYGFNNWLDFQIRDNELWFMFHMGGAIMGSDIYYKVNSNGKATEEFSGYLDFRKIHNGTLIINRYCPPYANNLEFLPDEHIYPNEKTAIGNSKLVYGWHTNGEGTYLTSNSTTIIDNNLYILASWLEEGILNRIYKINLNTNETVMLVEPEIINFKVINNRLYYIKKEDGYLYASDMWGENEKKISNNVFNSESRIGNSCYEIDGNVYYSLLEQGKKYLYKAELLKTDTKVLDEPIETLFIENNRLVCKLFSGEDYGVKVLNSSGDLELAITDQVKDVIAYKDEIIIITAKDRKVMLVEY